MQNTFHTLVASLAVVGGVAAGPHMVAHARPHTCPVVSARLGLHWPYSPWPENSGAAIQAAHQAGAPKVEVDVNFSRDGIPMVVHDPTIDRTTLHRGRVDAYTAAQLESFSLRVEGRSGNRRLSSQHVLPLLSALQRAKSYGMRISVEIKPDRLSLGQARAVDYRLAKVNDWSMIDVRSFDSPVLALMRRVDRRIRTTLIARRPVVPAPAGTWMESMEFDWNGHAIRDVTVAALHRSGRVVDGFTPDSQREFRSVPTTVDQITTNNVRGALAYLKSRGC